MITSRPRPSAPVANSAIHSGVRCAETMCRSCATPKRSSTSTACLIVSQSDDEPITTATSESAKNGEFYLTPTAAGRGAELFQAGDQDQQDAQERAGAGGNADCRRLAGADAA